MRFGTRTVTSCVRDRRRETDERPLPLSLRPLGSLLRAAEKLWDLGDLVMEVARPVTPSAADVTETRSTEGHEQVWFPKVPPT